MKIYQVVRDVVQEGSSEIFESPPLQEGKEDQNSEADMVGCSCCYSDTFSSKGLSGLKLRGRYHTKGLTKQG